MQISSTAHLSRYKMGTWGGGGKGRFPVVKTARAYSWILTSTSDDVQLHFYALVYIISERVRRQVYFWHLLRGVNT
jgi:hypothetical protein